MNPDDGITVLPGVGGQRARALNAMGIRAVKDLLFYFPRDYDDRSDVKTVAMLMPGATGTIRGRVSEIENISFAQKKTGKPLIMTKAKLRDETGELELIWFNQPYLKGYFRTDLSYVFTGKVKLSFKGKQMEAPDYSPEPQAATGGAPSVGIIPVYGTVKSVSQKMFRSIVFSALKYCGDFFCADDLPTAVIKKYNLCDINTAVRQIHFPESDAMFHAARRRLVFEELFFMQAALFKVKGAASGEPGRVMDDADISPFAEMLPFKLTAAQSKVLREIAADLRSGRRMNRLIQGDVGSGKTAVAMAAAYAVIKNGCQAAIMAPTASSPAEIAALALAAASLERAISLYAAAQSMPRAAILPTETVLVSSENSGILCCWQNEMTCSTAPTMVLSVPM